MPAINLTIIQLIESNLPTGFSVSTVFIDTQTKLWQMILWEAAGVPEADKYNINSYTEDWQMLIGYGIMWNIFQKVLGDGFINSVGSADLDSNSGVKKITTGPTEVEYHNGAQSFAAILKAMQGEDGIINQILSMGCMIASRLGIKMPFCKANNLPIPFIQIPYSTNCGCNNLTQCNDCCIKPASVG